MFTFEITKTNTSLSQKGLTPILIALLHSCVRQRLVLWNKAKPMLLTYREETKQPRHLIAARQSTIELIIISDAVYTGCGAAIWQIPTVNCRRVLFMTYWHKFQMIFNSGFVTSSVDRPCQDNLRIRCRHGVSLLFLCRRFPLLFFIRYLYLSVIARLG